jgi:Flp pilus assembly protein protease CpaA
LLNLEEIMGFDFLFWFYLFGIIIATMQDLKRREVDNWLNLFLLVGGIVFVLFGALLLGDGDMVFLFGLLLVVSFLVVNAFYYGRVFAGGDAKLLFAMTPFFLGETFFGSLAGFGVWILFLMVSGSVYGLFYSGFLWWKNRRQVNLEIRKQVSGFRFQVVGVLVFGILLMLLGFWNLVFLIVGGCVFVFPFLWVFAKGLERVSFVREVSGKDLREGDWLVNDVVVYRNKEKGKRKKIVVSADWEGLGLEDLKLLRGKKKVLIKEGLPFVPAFLIGFILYGFFGGWVLGLV